MIITYLHILYLIFSLLIYFLFTTFFQSKALGRILFEQVCKQLNLLEVDYFGLEYQDAQGITVRLRN